jgi:hypothetical protein
VHVRYESFGRALAPAIAAYLARTTAWHERLAACLLGDAVAASRACAAASGCCAAMGG